MGISLHCGGKHLFSLYDADGFSDPYFRPGPPPSLHDCISDGEDRSGVHCLRHLTIVWENLPPLGSLFFYCAETLPELDSLLPTEACWWNQNGLASHCRDFCFWIVSNYYPTRTRVWKRWWVRHPKTVKRIVAQRGSSICECNVLR